MFEKFRNTLQNSLKSVQILNYVSQNSRKHNNDLPEKGYQVSLADTGQL